MYHNDVWRVVHGNVFKNGQIILTKEGGTVDHRVSHADLKTALELWHMHAPS